MKNKKYITYNMSFVKPPSLKLIVILIFSAFTRQKCYVNYASLHMITKHHTKRKFPPKYIISSK